MPKRANQLAEAAAPEIGPAAKKKVGVAEKKPKVARKAAADSSGLAPKVKPNRRSEETIANIIAATGEVVLQSGADRISILDVCKVAGISRGTFYRYFSSQEDLLDTFSRHQRDSFHTSLTAALGGINEPEARLNALFAYIDNYLEKSRARRLLVVAPDYALGFFRRIFHDSIVRFQDVLDIVFDEWDNRLGVRLDRELICEMVIRYVLSEILVPESASRRLLPVRLKKLLAALTMGSTSRTRR
ncbi:MAG: DitK [Pseudomonas sp.]|nr:DitK [Pseudomonas sp.]